MISLHQSWYIQKDLSVVHSEFLTAIEVMIVHRYKADLP